MWFVVALIFIILSLNKLAMGAIFGFLVYIAFAGFAVLLNKGGFDITS